jgi:hypothetical protein
MQGQCTRDGEGSGDGAASSENPCPGASARPSEGRETGYGCGRGKGCRQNGEHAHQHGNLFPAAALRTTALKDSPHDHGLTWFRFGGQPFGFRNKFAVDKNAS